MEIQRYLKTGIEFARGKEVIQRNADIVQAANTPVCVHLCLFILKSLASGGEKFQTILDHMQHYGVDIHKVIGKIPFKPKRGFVLPKHRHTGSYNPLHLQLDSKDQPLPGEEPYNAVDVISMRHDICYRDNETVMRCDRKMLAELTGNGNMEQSIWIFFMHFYPGMMTTHAEPINSDLRRGLDRHLQHTQH